MTDRSHTPGNAAFLVWGTGILVLAACGEGEAPTTPPAPSQVPVLPDIPPPRPEGIPPPPPAPDGPGLVVSPYYLSLAEGESASLAIRLATQPTAPVTVALSPQFISPNFIPLAVEGDDRLLFSPDHWMVDQFATIVASQDVDDEDSKTAVYLDVTSEDPVYENLDRYYVPVLVADDDEGWKGLYLVGGYSGPLEGESAMKAVFLTGKPTGRVVVTVTSSDPGGLIVSAGATLVFGPDDFSRPQPFWITRVSDDFPNAEVWIEASGGGYDGAFRHWAPVSTELPAVVLSTQELSIAEGESDSFSLRLAESPAPGMDIAVRVTNLAPTALTIENAEPGGYGGGSTQGSAAGPVAFYMSIETQEFLFTSETWEVSQEVLLHTKQDDDAEDERIALQVETWIHREGTLTDKLGESLVAVTVLDDDRH